MNDKVFQHFALSSDDPRWSDWKWQYAHRITDVKTLSDTITLSDAEEQAIERCLDDFRMAITPYFASLIDPDDLACPIRQQVVPSISETDYSPDESDDPLDEEAHSPTESLVHRYPDRVLFLVTRHCASYCRFCIRKRHVGEEDFVISPTEIDRAIKYIREHPAIRDVLISGGDPLTLVDDDIENIIARIRAIDHVEIIRIGTRVPAFLPMRIDDKLLSMLRKYHPLYINAHFNHAAELTEEARRACTAIVDAGIPLGNQSVLLRGVNDNSAIMRDLMLKLVQTRVRPYYLYQCDLCKGCSHFRTSVQTGIEIIRNLTGNISGLAVPQYVIDAPQGGGKIPINPEYLLSIDDQQVEMLNFEGQLYNYPQPTSAGSI